MTPFLKPIEGFTVTGLATRTRNSDEFEEGQAKLPQLWQQFFSSNLAAHTPIFEVYSDYASDANDFYTVTLGVGTEAADPAFSTVNIPSGNYLVFEAKGPMPLTVIETWKFIWNYFETNDQYQRRFMSDFEAYNGSDELAIYIGVI